LNPSKHEPFLQQKERRKHVYINERIDVWLNFGNDQSEKFRLIDMTMQDMTVGVTKRRRKFNWQIKQKIKISFFLSTDKEFKCLALISHIDDKRLLGVQYCCLHLSYLRILCHSDQDFDKNIQISVFPCSTYILPQAYCYDPFFFGGKIHFHVYGIRSHGIDVLVSLRNKSLVPHMRIHLQIYVPGTKVFSIWVINSDIFQISKHQRLHLFLQYAETNKELNDALVQYLLMFSQKPLVPKTLRQSGFKFKDLTMAISLDYDFCAQEETQNILFQLTAFAQSTGNWQQLADKDHTRLLQVQIGQKPALIAGLHFLTLEREKSQLLKAYPYQIPETLWGIRAIEWTYASINPDFQLTDVFVPVMREVLRIALQDQCQILFLECLESIVPVFQKLGFRRSINAIKHFSPEKQRGSFVFCLMYLELSTVINHPNLLHKAVWEKIYEDLLIYLGARDKLDNRSDHQLNNA